MFERKSKSQFKELLESTADSRNSISDILRKVKLLAATLKSEMLKDWVNSELHGYEMAEDVPSYRRVNSPTLGFFSGPFGQSIKNYPIPLSMLDESVKEFAKEIILGQPIKELEEMSKSKDTLRRTWPAEAVLLAKDDIILSGGFVLIEAHQPITKPAIEGILDTIRNNILDFLIQLRDKYPELENDEHIRTQDLSDDISRIVNITIAGNHNVIASGTNINQNISKVVITNDIESLKQYLKSIKISPEDIEELEDSIKSDGDLPNREFGKNVQSWLGKMISKATSGLWKMSVSVGTNLLVAAIKNYYGW